MSTTKSVLRRGQLLRSYQSVLSTLHPCALQDKWLLHSVLMLVQSWIKPLVYLQTTLGLYDYAPDMLLNKTKWVSEKLISLEQGVVVLIKKVSQNALLDYCYTASTCNHYNSILLLVEK